MTQYISKDALIAEIKKIIPNEPYPRTSETLDGAATYGKRDMGFKILDLINTFGVKETGSEISEVDEKYKIGKWFTGLIPCWVDAPSTLQAAHNHHGENIVAIHLKEGGYRCCCVDDKNPSTFSLAEGTSLVEGWHNRKEY